MRGPARYQNVTAGEGQFRSACDGGGCCWRRPAASKCRENSFHEFGNFRQPPLPCLTTLCHFTDCGFDNRYTIDLQLCDVALRGGMEPHARVHGRGNNHRLIGRHQNGRCKVIGVPARHLCDEIGGRWCNDDEVGIPRQTDMTNLALRIKVEEICEDRLVRECPDGKRCHELFAGPRQDDPDRDAALL